MNREIYRYSFSSGVSLREVEESLLLAVLATESLHGRSLVRLDASFCLDDKKQSCVVDAGTEVGRDIARIFTGFLTREFGEDAFTVERKSKMVTFSKRGKGNQVTMDYPSDCWHHIDPAAVLSVLKRQIYALPPDSEDVVHLAQLFLLIKRSLAAGQGRNEVRS